MSNSNSIRNAMTDANPPSVGAILAGKSVFVAGAGGLGSNACAHLVRAGLGRLRVCDFDVVAPSNLNRQFFFADQIGIAKVDALRSNLTRIRPDLRFEALQARIGPDTFDEILNRGVDLILECFDVPESKALLAAHCAANLPDIPYVGVSGLAGVGRPGEILIRRGPGGIWLVGDPSSQSAAEAGTLSAKVAEAAAIQAHVGILLLLGQNPMA